MNIAIIGSYPPRLCGIATFTQDLYRSLINIPNCNPKIIAISDGSEAFYPIEVIQVIRRNEINSYETAANYINRNFDCVILQHEYGIFGGECGNYILNLASQLNIPFVTNFHTVLKDPSLEEKRILSRLAMLSQKVTVMTETAVHMLQEIFHIPPQKIILIPHGVPKFVHTQFEAKQMLGLSDKRVMLSFGFLGPSKGFETAIDATAKVLHEDFVYIILGSTHPNILREAGESYRNSLHKRIQELGLEGRVHLINRFASDDLLTQYLSACDIYVTPYPNENQISSGTLSFAIGAGAAVLSTPYWYAKDLLKNDRGLLFDFKNSDALALLVNQLLSDPSWLAKFRNNAATYGESISWKNIGKLHFALLKTLHKQVESPEVLNLSNNTSLSKFIQSTAHKLSS